MYNVQLTTDNTNYSPLFCVMLYDEAQYLTFNHLLLKTHKELFIVTIKRHKRHYNCGY